VKAAGSRTSDTCARYGKEGELPETIATSQETLAKLVAKPGCVNFFGEQIQGSWDSSTTTAGQNASSSLNVVGCNDR